MNYTERVKCIFCQKDTLSCLFDDDLQIPMGNNVVEEKKEVFPFMPYNVQQCKSCLAFQIKYVADLDILYKNNFAGAYGTIRSTHNTLFGSFIAENTNIQSICEIGAGNGELSDILLDKKSFKYTVIDPSYGGNTKNRNLVPKYIEQCTKEELSCNAIVMSHVFEHFYNPIDILKKLQALSHIEYIYISFPDLENFLRDGTYLVLTPEHTFYVDTSFLTSLFLYYGFQLKRSYSHEHHSIFFEFVRIHDDSEKAFPFHNDDVSSRVMSFFSNLQQNIQKVNNTMDTSIQSFIWPCSMHTLFVLAFGLDKKRLTSVLDNSPLKIGRYLFGHNLECYPFSTLIESDNKKNIILAGGCYNKEVVKLVQKNPNNVIYLV